MGNFYTDVLRKSPKFLSTYPVGDMELLEPITRQKVAAIISDLASHGFKAVAAETYRSQVLQEKYFEQGNTKLRTVGCHHFGVAADIVYVDKHGNQSWTPPAGFWHMLAHLAHVHGMITGQDWGTPSQHHSFIDYPHVQFCSIHHQPGLFNGTWYPTDSYDPYKDL